MAKLLQATQGNNKVLAGKIISVQDGKGSSAGKVQNVSISGYVYNKDSQKEEHKIVSVGFFNSDKRDDVLENRNQRADRIHHMNLKPGTFVILSVYEKNGKLYGNDIRRGSGVLRLKGADGTDYDTNVLLGSVVRTRYNAERGVTNADILADGRLYDENGPISSDGKAQYGSITNEVAFWNSEKNPNAAENAEKCLAPKESADGSKQYARVVVVTGSVKEHRTYQRKDGSLGYSTNYGGYSRFDFVPATKKSDDAPASSGSSTPEPAEDELEESLPWS